ncbi:hypothetical protein [Snodgrassella alvi]|uniref:hypothetical protein n=1 Tax=Snodgrassella alvi TaxID=1196083 RepID=UPI0021495B9E|nr:hypothetical protein [Snodgrassella alvi]
MAFAVYLMLFDTPAKGIVDVAVTLAAAYLFDAYFTQAVFGVVGVCCVFCLPIGLGCRTGSGYAALGGR